MKATVQFTLDLTGTSYDPATTADIKFTLENISQLIGSLEGHACELKVDALCSKTMPNEECRAAAIAAYDDDIKVCRSIFRDWHVSGETVNGHKYDFHHNGETYRQKYMIDGREEGA